jgi:hypothetical protein
VQIIFKEGKMLKRTTILMLLLLSIIGLSYTVPGSTAYASPAGKITSCTNPDYRYERIDGVCYLVEYCDGVGGNKIPAPDGMCP